jgi:putative FmdB family regulatory protein
MPLYDYMCNDCGRQSELLINASATDPKCPECGSPRLSKMLPVVAAHARGDSSPGGMESPPGPCGSSCGCFPHG